MENLPAELELRNRAYVLGPQEKRIGWMVVGLMGVALAVSGYTLSRLFADPAAGDALGHLLARRASGPWHGMILLVATALLVLEFGFLWLAGRKERLFLDASGIRLQSPLPPVLQFLYPGWSVKWSQVRRVRLDRISWIPGPAGVVLVIDAYGGERRIRVYTWIDATRSTLETPSQALRRLRAMDEAELAKSVTESPVVRYVRARLPNLRLDEAAFTVKRPFALEKSPRALIAVAVLFVLIAYGLGDFMLNAETYAAMPPVVVFVMAGALAAAVVFGWLRHAVVPMAESIVIAILVGVALGAALYPGLLRLNQLTDTAGLQTVRYVLRADFSLVPEREGPPVLRFPNFLEYWMQFTPGSVHEFRMRRGGLDFYQIDMAPVHEQTREFFRKPPGSSRGRGWLVTGDFNGA